MRILIYVLIALIPYCLIRAFWDTFNGGFGASIIIGILWQIADENYLNSKYKK